MKITAVTIADMTFNKTFSTTKLQATGGIGAYTWTITAGSLPMGLKLSSAGVLYGKPIKAGPYTFTVTVKDTKKVFDAVTFTGTVAAH